MWKDGEAWIIGGGPSMPKQFGVPEEIINKVRAKELPISAYSEYLHQIHDKNSIGVNLSFMLGPWVSVMYFCDRTVFRIYREEMSTFTNIKATCTNHLDRELLPASTNIKRLKRDMRHGLSHAKDTICWNGNSGGAAINFAIHAGVKRVLLLGFDMKADKTTHWHTGTKESCLYNHPTSAQVYQRFMKAMPVIEKEAKERKVEILNVNLDSAIEAFKKVSLQEVL